MIWDTLPPQDESTNQIRNSYLKVNRSYTPDLMPILETRSEVKVAVTWKMEWDNPLFQDAFTYQIWDSYLK